MPMAEEEWTNLCNEFFAKQSTTTGCLRSLFRNGTVSTERMADFRRLRAEEKVLRDRMEEFLKAQAAR